MYRATYTHGTASVTCQASKPSVSTKKEGQMAACYHYDYHIWFKQIEAVQKDVGKEESIETWDRHVVATLMKTAMWKAKQCWQDGPTCWSCGRIADFGYFTLPFSLQRWQEILATFSIPWYVWTCVTFQLLNSDMFLVIVTTVIHAGLRLNFSLSLSSWNVRPAHIIQHRGVRHARLMRVPLSLGKNISEKLWKKYCSKRLLFELSQMSNRGTRLLACVTKKKP